MTTLFAGRAAARAAAAALVAMGLGLSAAGLAAAPAGAAKELRFAPGVETRVDDATVGPSGHYLVYVPTDYTPDRTWPALFCYHGLRQLPATMPYKDFVDGRGFVIVAMDYWWNSMDTSSKITRDVETARRVVPQVAQRVKIDPQQVFLAGNSAGGWLASGIAEAAPSLWAGAVILGAGRQANLTQRPLLPTAGSTGGGAMVGPWTRKPAAPRNPATVAGMPIYIGLGDGDPNLQFAQWAADYYRSQGADVTFETYAGAGHGAYPKTKAIAEFLVNNGPVKQAQSDVADARKAEAAGQWGQAYAKYVRAASAPGGYAIATEAGKAAEAIGQEAERQLAAAETAVAEKRFPDAAAAYTRVAERYDGSAYAEKARQRIIILKTDPTVRMTTDRSRANAQAEALEAKARAAEQAKDYALAIRLYEQLVATCRKADRWDAVRTHLADLKADKDVQAAVREQEAERDCRSWLAMADAFLAAGKPDKAREYLQKILDKYADTTWGKQARERLAKVVDGGAAAPK